MLEKLDNHVLKNETGSSYTKINSKWIKDIKVRAKTIQLLGESRVVNLCDLGLGSGFLDTRKAQVAKREREMDSNFITS